jgi:hypothetical protein
VERFAGKAHSLHKLGAIDLDHGSAFLSAIRK